MPNGKLLKIFLEDEGGKISNIKITGDFFLYPEERIEELEVALRGTAVEKNALTVTIATFLQRNPATLFGLDQESLVTTICNAT